MTKSRFELDEAFPHAEAITGIDEVGRGCLAGPVVVAAVTWSPASLTDTECLAGLNDSKQLTADVREWLYPRILVSAIRVRLAVIAPPVIDRLNILRATLHGFELTAPPYREEIPLIIDGNQRPASLKWAQTAVKGDARSSAVAAAAVVAKVFRDALMTGLGGAFPGYGFALHKGYATRTHREGLEKLGPMHQHRKSFRPVKDMVPEQAGDDARLPEMVATAAAAEIPRLWAEFNARYHRFSHRGARLAVDAFQRRGAGILPKPDEQPFLNRVEGVN
ncbi:MAG: ribonuclease HII [Acidobacteriota bacterium]|nr:ribonuclease HII [Acidobacteriota bacterium]